MSQGALLGNQWRSNSNRSATSGTTSGVVGRCPGLGGGVRGDTQQWLNRSKLSKRCFWNACKALSFGLLLMVIGGSMATIGECEGRFKIAVFIVRYYLLKRFVKKNLNGTKKSEQIDTIDYFPKKSRYFSVKV